MTDNTKLIKKIQQAKDDYYSFASIFAFNPNAQNFNELHERMLAIQELQVAYPDLYKTTVSNYKVGFR